MPVQLLLLDTLEDLTRSDFEKFKWYLSINVLDSYKPIPRSYLERCQHRTDTVSVMIQSYSEDGALDITVEILKMMNNNDAAERLKIRNAERKTAAPSCTSTSAVAPPAAPAAPATMLAQQGSVIISPTVSGGTSGTWNITINK